MSVFMRLEFQVTDGPNGETPTVGDLRKWLATADAKGAEDSAELIRTYDEREDLEGFFIYLEP
jgi:hypothetical protein